MQIEMQHWLPLSDQVFTDPLWSCRILNLGLPLIKLHPAELIWRIMQHLQPIEGYLECKFKNHQDDIIFTKFMRQLVTKHSNRSTDSTRNTRATTLRKSGTDGQSITDVMESISNDYHPCHSGNSFQ